MRLFLARALIIYHSNALHPTRMHATLHLNISYKKTKTKHTKMLNFYENNDNEVQTTCDQASEVVRTHF